MCERKTVVIGERIMLVMVRYILNGFPVQYVVNQKQNHKFCPICGVELVWEELIW
jgi:hypothetical protein